MSEHRILPLDAENVLSRTFSLNATDLFCFDFRTISFDFRGISFEFESKESFSHLAFKTGAEKGIQRRSEIHPF